MNISSINSFSSSDIAAAMMKRTGKSQSKPPDPSEFVSKIMEKDDANGDGVLSADETKLDSEQFGALDTDGNGSLTTEELLASFPPRTDRMPPMFGQQLDFAQIASKIIENEDSNGDGVISASETRLDSERFNTIDSDGNGAITSEELQADFEARQAERAQQMPADAGAGSSIHSLLESLSQNEASSAYAGQNWLYQMLQTSSQNLAVMV